MALTYSNRSNARRAAVQAGLDRDRVEITVHKLSDGVRFGFTEKIEFAGKPINTMCVSYSGNLAMSNGIRRPRSGGVCSAIWEWIDRNRQATFSDIKVVGLKMGWNRNTVLRQFYECRKFLGIGCLASEP